MYDTAEYRATVGAVSANALAAYNRAATGLGIKVAIIDSGIDLTSQEFTGRIDPASAYLAGTGTIQDEGGHGTAVAFTVGGRRNGVGTHGFAFDATLLIARTDNPGSCTTTGTNGGCKHNDANIAAGVDLARTNGARVINISLGGSPASTTLVNAINRATAAGIIIVISAGNDATPDPDPLAQIALNDAVARNLVIIAGSVGTSDLISTFSDRAGTGAAHYLAAVGESVRAPDNTGTPFFWTGTSFSAPQIAGAVALLAQAFPTLTGAQIVDILYQSARDAGAVGTDTTYGRGILDLTRAFSPLGSTSLAGSRQPVSLVSNATLSAPMGDAPQNGLGAVILDGYSRAFAIDLAQTIRSTAPVRTLTNALAFDQKNYAVALGGTAVAVTIAPGQYRTAIERLTLSDADAFRARTLAASVTSKLGNKTSFAIGIAQNGAVLEARLAGRRDAAFLIARDPLHEAGFTTSAGSSVALRHMVGRWGVTATAEGGAVLTRDDTALAALAASYGRSGYDRVSLGLDRRFGPVSAAVTASNLREYNSVLGARFGGSLGASRATSWFVDAQARIEPGHGWSIGGSWRQGWTVADVRGGLTGNGVIRTNAFAADISKAGVFSARDRLGVRVAQPLRVASGGIDLNLPTNYDYTSARVDAYTAQRLNLTPTGHELDVEMAYGRPIGPGDLQTNFFWRRDPGNFAALPDDYGWAMRYSFAF